VSRLKNLVRDAESRLQDINNGELKELRRENSELMKMSQKSISLKGILKEENRKVKNQ